ncbi:hypothetical protein NEUTE1DRAFT_102687 [Neurospora tetrasperma FGSC 2508]|uniref:Prolyl 4-hydroxylase alpha subunit Fe(2+) 2OG dioxygenase domain-containing protein n=1 Tax=Neurospora tetrasperma (strain FGSC 2508 / ATCC MYA-4615 / P0657) TaxID=510951 RepID=F8MTB4_NEUT8|nr:uncharacterized protein NEUTE1DRAFT_102687 [Neurospora tetrasperma FGSC 2508]EGO55246.1 hypothetical protein NEUTE1DRAFT_102687 [Neurospora tetrasperma FGSC 2508]
MADHQPTQALSVEGNSSNIDSSDISASLSTDSTQDGQTDDGSDQDSVTSDLSTQDYTVSLKDDLRKALDDVKVAGSFASFRKLLRSPPAGLYVDGVGDVAMPLGETQARQLIAKARQAPYGRGSETIVDTSVRNTWEIDAAQFSFNNQRWPGYVRQLCSHVAADLGIKSPIRAEIYKMLIYERGAMFKSHTDTEKIPGQFGTLVVALPSAHKGGDVVVKHCGEQKTFKTSEHGQSFICWYSDVHHKVCPVESGYRWVLTYNLALDPNAVRPSAGLVRSETEALCHTLREWLQEPAESRQNGLYYVLDHDYTEASIKLNNLKTRDLAIGQVLNNLSKELDFEVFFALLEKEEFGEAEVDHSRFYNVYQELIEVDYRVKTVRDMFGNPVVDGLALDPEEEILQNDGELFADDDPEQEYEGVVGNSGPKVTHWYRSTAAMDLAKRSTTTGDARSTIWPKNPLIDGNDLMSILKVAIELGDYDSFDDACLDQNAVIPTSFFTWTKQWLKRSNTDSSFKDISELAALTNLIPKPEDADCSASLRDEISTWVHGKLEECLGDLLMKEKEVSADVVPRDDGFAIYRTIAKQFLASVDFSKVKPKGGIKPEHGNKRQRTSYDGGNKRPPKKQLLRTVASNTLVKFFETLVKISTPDDDLATQFITNLNDDVPRLPVDHMHNLWLPFLWCLIPILTANAIPLTTPVYQSLYRSMLTRYIKEYVRTQPAPSNSLVRPPVNCPHVHCPDCNALNFFLQSPTEEVERFDVGKKARRHLHEMLDERGIDCTHVSERGTTPNTLVVTKTFTQEEQPMKEWKEKKEYAASRLRIFETYSQAMPELRVLLGEQFDRIMNMEDVYPNPAGARRTAPRPLASASGIVMGRSRVGASGSSRSTTAPRPVAGVKRSRSVSLEDGVETVDLTED